MKVRINGIFGQSFLDLGFLITDETLDAVDREISLGLARVETSYTGASLKWMGVVAPWCMEDGYRDLMDAIENMSREEYADFVALSDEPEKYDVDRRDGVAFGDETDNPLTKAQMRLLAYRHEVYFPWKVCYHLLENDKWDDKHSGAGKTFGEEALEVFPKTIEMVRRLPFREMGRVVIFGVEANDHAPLHRDTEPGKSLSVAQCISIDPRGNKQFYLQNDPEDEPSAVDARVYWFNDMDYHGVLAAPYFRYSIRVDGVFEPAFLRDIEAKTRKRGNEAQRAERDANPQRFNRG